MAALLLSLTIGVGLSLLYDALTRPAPLTVAPPRWQRRLGTWLAQAGLHDITPRDFALVSAGVGLACGLAAQLVAGWIVLSLFAAILGGLAPLLVYVYRHNRRRAAVGGALVEAITQLRDAIRSGLSVQEALAGLARNGPAALRPEFSLLVREAELLGFAPAISHMQGRLADPVFDLVASALCLNDRMGGRQISALLDRLADATREEQQLQAELRATRAKHVLSARIVAAVPLVLLLLLRKVNPTYVAVFDTAQGQLWLAGCVASVVVGYLAMLAAGRLPDDERVLALPGDGEVAR